MPPHGHAAADRRNLALHRAALAKLRRDPALRADCLALVTRWLAAPEHAPARGALERWRDMLAGWSDDALAAVVLDADRGQTLRQCSPLAPALTPQERWAVLRDVNQELARATAPVER